jgi:hypothetical protein
MLSREAANTNFIVFVEDRWSFMRNSIQITMLMDKDVAF